MKLDVNIAKQTAEKINDTMSNLNWNLMDGRFL